MKSGKKKDGEGRRQKGKMREEAPWSTSRPFTQDIIFHGMRRRGSNEKSHGVPTCRRTNDAAVSVIVVVHTTGSKHERVTTVVLAPSRPLIEPDVPFSPAHVAAVFHRRLLSPPLFLVLFSSHCLRASSGRANDGHFRGLRMLLRFDERFDMMRL